MTSTNFNINKCNATNRILRKRNESRGSFGLIATRLIPHISHNMQPTHDQTRQRLKRKLFLNLNHKKRQSEGETRIHSLMTEILL